MHHAAVHGGGGKHLGNGGIKSRKPAHARDEYVLNTPLAVHFPLKGRFEKMLPQRGK